MSSARRTLVLGIGGGGDVVGALAIGREIEARGGEFELGGVAWERWSIDPRPGPRRLEELAGVEQLAGTRGALCGAEGATADGTRLCEAGAAAHLGRPTVLIDVTEGPRGCAAGIDAACERLGCEAVVLADVGGDVLATGDEPGLASPLCDAILLASARHLPVRVATSGCVLGAGCDGELTHAEVLARVAALARSGGWLGSFSLTTEMASELVELAKSVPTEASLCAARCALGEIGPVPIRGGRRTVELGPLGALAFAFDAAAAIGDAAPLAGAVVDADSIESARDALAALGIRTELDWERDRAAETPT